jgi:YD repeat-containing protein
MWIDNRIVRLDGIENTFDGAGNLIRRKDKDGAILELSYDGAHRLSVLRRTKPDGTKLRAWYAYDALSRRIAKGVSKDGGEETTGTVSDVQRLNQLLDAEAGLPGGTQCDGMCVYPGSGELVELITAFLGLATNGIAGDALVRLLGVRIDAGASEDFDCAIAIRGKSLRNRLINLDAEKVAESCKSNFEDILKRELKDVSDVSTKQVCRSEAEIQRHRDRMLELVNRDAVCGVDDPYGQIINTLQIPIKFSYAKMRYRAPSRLYLTKYWTHVPQDGRWVSGNPIEEIGRIPQNLNQLPDVEDELFSNNTLKVRVTP